jgi:hypothetical protein
MKRRMKKILTLLWIFSSLYCFAQPAAHVDKKSKEFLILTGTKGDYRMFGYQYPNITTKTMICFSSNANDVRDNFSKCPLGSYFDTGKMKEGDRILYLGPTGSFGKFSFIAGNGKKTIFYFPKSDYAFK